LTKYTLLCVSLSPGSDGGDGPQIWG